MVTAGALIRSLARVERGQTTYKPGWVSAGADGQAQVRVFPVEWWEPLLLSGYRLDVSMQSGITPANLAEHTARFYRDPPPAGRVCAVLGAGNIASIPPLDVLYKLYAEGQVVALKLNPVNDYLGPIYSEIFSDFIDRGFLRLFYGGNDTGAPSYRALTSTPSTSPAARGPITRSFTAPNPRRAGVGCATNPFCRSRSQASWGA